LREKRLAQGAEAIGLLNSSSIVGAAGIVFFDAKIAKSAKDAKRSARNTANVRKLKRPFRGAMNVQRALS
jgi:hypothetical protein